MSASNPEEFRTRILPLDGEVFHIVYRGGGLMVAERLAGSQRSLAMRFLDDAHAEASAHLMGGPSLSE